MWSPLHGNELVRDNLLAWLVLDHRAEPAQQSVSATVLFVFAYDGDGLVDEATCEWMGASGLKQAKYE